MPSNSIGGHCEQNVCVARDRSPDSTVGTLSAKDKASEAFLKKAIEGNYAEVSMGDLAQKNGQSDGVRSFGTMLSTPPPIRRP
jgi:hypothetical protein